MKKIIIILFLALSPALFSFNVSAEEKNDDKYNKIIEHLDEQIQNSTDYDIKSILENNNISIDNPNGISKISVSNVLSEIYKTFLSMLKNPLIMLGKIISVAIFCSITQNISTNNNVTKQHKIIGVLCTVIITYKYIFNGFNTISNTLNSLNKFMISYIPVFVGVSTASGNAISSGEYYTSTMFLCEIIAFVSKKVLMPLLSFTTAVSLISTINTELRFSSVSLTIKKCIQWILGILMTLFTGILSIQGIIGSSSDSIKMRTIKFAASNFVPIVGGAVSDAYSTVYGSIGVIKSGVGTIGIIILSVMLLKPLISLITIKLIIILSKLICDLFNQKESSIFLDGSNNVLSIGMSILIVFSVIFIISTAILMTISTSVYT